jgi:hypothetical protein
VSDEFFKKVNDPYLKINYEDTKRPHYYAFEETKKGLLWLVPCSLRVDKFRNIVNEREKKGKPTYGIKIIKIQGLERAILFQDMFPTAPRYIEAPYIRGGKEVGVTNAKVIADLERSAKRVISIIRSGIKLMPTQPDILRIERLMLDELRKENHRR